MAGSIVTDVTRDGPRTAGQLLSDRTLSPRQALPTSFSSPELIALCDVAAYLVFTWSLSAERFTELSLVESLCSVQLERVNPSVGILHTYVLL